MNGELISLYVGHDLFLLSRERLGGKRMSFAGCSQENVIIQVHGEKRDGIFFLFIRLAL